ncbi:MAG: amino acid permease [Candidatus Omnitrophica bacterium]|nr:amino acid permease [Candidatus Omnitrophota bacterium]
MAEKSVSNGASFPNSHTGYQFGAFKGVYTPSLLTILGVIMYLRFGWVLGNVGLFLTLVIVTLSTSITLLTALSISALASNMQVKGGGAYYILSRSLGLEAGAAVGWPLFLAQALGISFYIAGFAESVVSLCPFLPFKLFGIAVLTVLTLLAIRSANLALRLQFLILTLIALSLASFFLGAPPQNIEVLRPESPVSKLPFWTVFAVFFPAVTGIEAGLAMSGDLKDPAKALPRGTLGAVITSYFVYMAIPFFLARIIRDENVLLANPMIMREIARWGNIVLAGLWGATLSSALGALLGAPRTLQAMAKDGVAPRFFSKGFGAGKDPRFAVAAAFLIGVGGLLSGGLNVIAPVLSMFFLTSYGLLNLSAGFEEFIASPAWRPKFRVHWGVSLMGAFLCFSMMFMINAGATFMAVFACAGLYVLMRKQRLHATWHDIRQGILMLAARSSIYSLARHSPDKRTWRPNILVLSGSPTMRWYLIALADAISHGKGFLTVATILSGPEPDAERVSSVRKSIEEFLKKRQIPSLVKIHSAENVLQGAQELIRTYGFGPLVPNTVLLGETEKHEQVEEFVRLIRLAHRSKRNLVIVRENDEPMELPRDSRIDIWWGGRTNDNAHLMLALGYLLQNSPEWTGSRLNIKTIADEEQDKEEVRQGLLKFLEESRLDVEVEVYTHQGRSVFEVIGEASSGASLVFLGMRAPEEGEETQSYEDYYRKLMKLTDGYPATAMVMAAEDIRFGEIFTSET